MLGVVEDEIWFAIQGLGSIYLLRGDYANTKKHLKYGLDLAKAHHISDAIALGETYLGYIDMQNGQLTAAQKHIDLALQSAQDPLFRYRAHHAAGHIARQLENYETARDYYFKSVEFLAEANYMDTSDVWLGFTNLGQKKLDKAVTYFQRYLDNHRSYGNQRVLGMAKFGMARYYELQGDLSTARTLASEAHDILFALNAQWELKQVSALLFRLAEQIITVHD